MDTIQVRIDKKTKREVKRVLDTLGLDLSSAIKIYLRQITRTHGIPFPLVTENGFTPQQEQRLVEESNETIRAYNKGEIKGYASTKELMKDLLK